MRGAACHGADRLGSVGPALLPENLRRLRRAKAAHAIANGLPATQMPASGQHLDEAQIAALVDLIYTPLPEAPVWGAEQIRASRVIHVSPQSLGEERADDADPLNLFVVVESGDHHVTILDGDAL